ncbi:TadE family type IV pilus minor pilin [Corynebacterium ulceribovis]|uniref:TadE family type IV pilus minor pilin n=1 Tax=Corynebacterium ulceribovis TaxID=487732 RepID=UPI000372E6D8|nr:TadE family type IV pilus minor pilin [Corynebacterium ulceribovis]
MAIAGEEGSATVEAAFGISSLVAVLVLAFGGLSTVATHIAATAAARDIARAAARGEPNPAGAASKIHPKMQASVRSGGGRVTAEVRVPMPLVDVKSTAVAVAEPTTEEN